MITMWNNGIEYSVERVGETWVLTKTSDKTSKLVFTDCEFKEWSN